MKEKREMEEIDKRKNRKKRREERKMTHYREIKGFQKRYKRE